MKGPSARVPLAVAIRQDALAVGRMAYRARPADPMLADDLCQLAIRMETYAIQAEQNGRRPKVRVAE